MNFSSHAKAGLIVSGISIAAGLLFRNDLRTSVFAGMLAFFGSIFPDLDTDSIPSRWAARFGLAFTAICIYYHDFLSAAIAGLLFFMVKSTKHRGITHSYFIPMLCFGLGIYFQNFIYAAFGIGLLCHLLLDRAYFS